MINRIAPQDNYAPTHAKANAWLTDFLIDLKTMCRKQSKGEDYQPFTIERLNEWSEWVSPEYSSCWDWESATIKRLSDNPVYEHDSEIAFFNTLIIDLKLMVSGLEYDAITDERLAEADRHWAKLMDCKKTQRIYY